MDFSRYEDTERSARSAAEEQLSPGRDVVVYESSVTPGVRLAMTVTKPARPSPLLVSTHGWHMDMGAFRPLAQPSEENYLRITVDMRGRAFSGGHADANMLELCDVRDAVCEARRRYPQLISDADEVHFEAGSGGGGNAMALACKFPDLFCSVCALYGISDYALWYENDAKGEFRDELDVWAGGPPHGREEVYAARSGAALAGNLLSPVLLLHGELDARVPAVHSRLFAEAAAHAGRGGLVTCEILPGVGGRSHTQNASPEQLAHIADSCEAFRRAHRTPPELPQGDFILAVGGYAVTKHFEIFLENPDSLVRVRINTGKRLAEPLTPGARMSVRWLQPAR